MFSQLQKILNISCRNGYLQNTVVRNGHHMRGKPPGEAKSLAQVLEEINYVDPEIAEKIDIGLPPPRELAKSAAYKRSEFIRELKNDKSLEKAARNNTLRVDTDAVKQEWLQNQAPQHVQMAAEHYGVFQDLFGDAYFTPHVHLDVAYKLSDDKLAPVFRGNTLKPRETSTAPVVEFSSKPDELWTLVLTNPDGHLTEENKECVHWFVGNIPGGDVSKGETVWDYLQPFPPLGIGFQRLIFVLYKQEKKLDFSSLKKQIPCRDLNERTFKTLDFYRERQDDLTPAGLAFFQTDWDPSVRDVFHKILNMEQPRFEYEFPTPYIRPQEWFARRKPFNMYLDKYRDPRDIAKDFLVKKLEKLDPFEKPAKPYPYPNIYRVNRNKTASWIITEQRRVKLGLGRINHQKDDL